jgi:predicted nucleic acid-binding protein
LIALDTNILIYGLADPEDSRQSIALDLLQRLANSAVIVPVPVFGEFLNACRRKSLLAADEAIIACQLWAEVYECPLANLQDYVAAARTSARFGLQYFDALIVTVAARAGATMLLSEDMHDGLVIDGLTIINPFDSANENLLAARLGSAL